MCGQIDSLKVKVLSIVFFTCVPVLFLLFWMNYYSINLIEQRIYENDYDILNLNVYQLDEELNKVSNYLVREALYRSDTEEYAATNVEISEPAAQRYKQAILENEPSFNYIEGIGCYSAKNGKQVYYFSEYSSSFLRRMDVLAYIRGHVEELVGMRGRWATCLVEGYPVLICAAGNENVLFYAWTTFDTLSIPVSVWKLEEGVSCVMTSLDGILQSQVEYPQMEELDYSGELDGYYYSGKRDEYMITGVQSSVGDFRMMAVVDRRRLLGSFYNIRLTILIALAIFVFFMIPWLLRSLHRSVFEPISRMEEGMIQIEKGNFEIQIANDHSSRELAHLIDSFNEMVRQVGSLKIQVYEDALDRQQLEMDYLQLQLEPHFYLNALNLMNLMAQAGDTKLILRLTENLSAYLRYIVSTGNGQVILREELEHVGHYLNIMEIRLGDNFLYLPEVDETLMDMMIPSLMIQTLIENSMKYAFDIMGENRIGLRIQKEEGMAVFTVRDNGKGYPTEILENFQEGKEPEGKHIGLWNLKRRLVIQYGGRADFRIGNLSPCGACTRIIIPLCDS